MAVLKAGLSRREFLMLAHTLKEGTDVAGMLVSIKLDGQRCLWDGGCTTGMKKKDVPWANNAKDERYKTPPISTGLWSRFGNVIHAPAWFIKGLPKGVMLDGELYQDRGKFQETRTIVSRLEPTEDWSKICFHVFDRPAPHLVFRDGHVNVPNFAQEIKLSKCVPILKRLELDWDQVCVQEAIQEINRLWLGGRNKEVWRPVEFTYLSLNEDKAQKRLKELLEIEVAKGGEGLMLRHPDSVWTPQRSHQLLKVKPQEFDEGVVLGWTSGKGKLLGLMGNLLVKWTPVRGKPVCFELSGFTDEERHLDPKSAKWARRNPGQESPFPNGCLYFPEAARVQFTYRTLTDDGIPREARFKRA